MSAFAERRVQDIEKLRALQRQSSDRIRVTAVSGRPPNSIEVDLHFKTVPSSRYPRAVQNVTKLAISLPARYPLVEPIVEVKTPILHPNIYSTGRVCLGVRWLPNFGLDLLVRRVVQIVIYDPTILNERSAANRDALEWYLRARASHAGAFPTDKLNVFSSSPQKTMSWNNSLPQPPKSVVSCPSCQSKISLPSGRSGRVKCPQCGQMFQAAT